MNFSLLRPAVALAAALTLGGTTLTAAALDSASNTLSNGDQVTASTTRMRAPGSEFVNQFARFWAGRYVDFDNAYGNQCWDLAAQFTNEVGYGPIATGNGAARGIYELYGSNGNSRNYVRIANTETNAPNPGDIIVWNSSWGGGFGHVAIVIEGNGKNVTVLEQNSPTGNAIRVHTYPNYSGVLGWLRPNKWA